MMSIISLELLLMVICVVLLKPAKEGIFKLTVSEMCNRWECPPKFKIHNLKDKDNVLIEIVTLHGLVSAGL
ncbi:unnamed protein product [Rhodiola kirilowii]